MHNAKKLLMLALAFVLALGVMGLAGCGDTAEDPADDASEEPADEPAYTLIQDGMLLVGSDTSYPPFESITETGEVVGFDVDLVAAIADELGLDFEFKTYGFDGLIIGLQTGTEFDIVASAMTIKPDRAEQIDFSDPYFDAGQILAVRVDSEIESFEEMAGLKIGVQSGTTGAEYSTDNAPEGATVVPFENILQAFQALQNGDVDGVVNDLPITEVVVADEARELKMVGDVMSAEQYGIGVNKENPGLLEAINEAIAAIKADGRYDALMEKWFSAEEE